MSYIDRVLDKINRGEVAVGTHIKWEGSTAVDVLSRSGFDYVWLDGEHGIFTRVQVADYIRAAHLNHTAVFHRIPYNKPELTKPFLEMGVDAIIFPMVNNRREAEEAVKSVLYPPEGVRGFGPGMANDYGMMGFEEYLEQAKKVWKIIQIEHIDAVNHIDEILSAEGVDAVIIGMYDLSGSMGVLAQLQSEKLLKACDYIAEKCKEYKKPFGSSISYDELLMSQWFARGASFMTIGGDADFLVSGSKQAIEGAVSIYERVKKG